MGRLLILAIAACIAATVGGVALASPSQQSSATVQAASNAKFGQILVNAQGMTLYTLSSEAGGNVQCSGSCVSSWTPLKLRAGQTAPTVGPGVTGAVSTLSLPDYSLQVTYNGFPLYSFSGDSSTGDTNGDGLQGPGSGTWHVAVITATTAPTATPTAPVSTGPLVQIASNAKLGNILVNSQGRTLYYLTVEKASTTTVACTGGCLGTWPPLKLPAGANSPSAGPGVTGTLSAFSRTDVGGQQVAYNDEPLYVFSQDANPGDTNGDGIQAFGGTWYAARVDNTPLATHLTVHITSTGKKVWGRVTVQFSLKGKKHKATCSKATCQLTLPARITARLSEKATNSKTWPFGDWKIRAGTAKARVLHTASPKVSGDQPIVVTAVYKLAH
jgi:predicted lipoprotein with Yx(FWY)xxD motif